MVTHYFPGIVRGDVVGKDNGNFGRFSRCPFLFYYPHKPDLTLSKELLTL